MIQVEHLKKHYAATVAVDDVSFDVAKHEILGFLGPNGAGKSTTLRVLTGYLAATAGRVTVDGADVLAKPEAVKRVIGYLPENVPLYSEMRVEEYLNYRAGLKKVPLAKRKQAVEQAVERCRLQDMRRRIIGQLSKGYRQRVGLADALVGDPKILILDEPTIGLDPNQIREIRNLIRELGKERTVILSSHILPEVEAVCSRVLIINKGRIVGQGKPEELRESMQSGGVDIAVEVRDSSGKAPDTVGALEGIRSVRDIRQEGDRIRFTAKTMGGEDLRERIFDAAVSEGFKLLELTAKSVSLEDIFVEITTSEEHGGQEKKATIADDTPDREDDDNASDPEKGGEG